MQINRIIILIIVLLTFTSCNDKRENAKNLLILEDNIDLAIKSQDVDFVEYVIDEIILMEKIYPEHQSLKEKKYILEIRLHRYNDAIETIDSLLELSPSDIDNRIVQGILLEIIGELNQSMTVFEKSLDLIDHKISTMLKKDQVKKLGRDINRIMILKLLNRDSQSDYDLVKSDPYIVDHPEILTLLNLLEQGSREQIINRYR